jgi:hypothetical protein
MTDTNNSNSYDVRTAAMKRNMVVVKHADMQNRISTGAWFDDLIASGASTVGTSQDLVRLA